jgi:hypothetical protein
MSSTNEQKFLQNAKQHAINSVIRRSTSHSISASSFIFWLEIPQNRRPNYMIKNIQAKRNNNKAICMESRINHEALDNSILGLW